MHDIPLIVRQGLRPITKLFQTSFYEHIIRGREDYEEIAEYIVNNPKQWELDELHSGEYEDVSQKQNL